MKSDDNVNQNGYVDEFYEGVNGEHVPLRIFYPNKSNQQSVIIFPGASPYAEKHPTMNKLAHALTQTGCTVFMPRIPPLKELEISEKNINWFAHCYEALLKHKDIESDNLFVVGISYGGGLLLKASLDNRFRNNPPKLFFVYGTYFNIETAFHFLMTGEIFSDNKTHKITPNPWGTVVLFYNYLLSIEDSEINRKYTEILKLRIEDRFEESDDKIETLAKNDQEFIRDILAGNMSEKVKESSHRIIEKNKDIFLSLSPVSWCKDIQEKVYVMHGANDSMVPFTESTFLADNLPNSELLISYLYEHKEISTNKGVFFKIKELFRLFIFFAHLFDNDAN
jgi:hypothetical protein